jgi:hypothetical protein
MAFGVLDLSLVTDQLIDLLEASVGTSALWNEASPGGLSPPFDITISGNAPEAVRDTGGCQVSLYLFHVAPDRAYRNTPVQVAPPSPGTADVRPRAQRIPFQPLALELHYLLTAYSANSPNPYIQEQQVMSVALKCFHENPVVRATAPDGHQVEVTLTLDPEPSSALAPLWQATTAAMRLSAVYRVAVVFLEPPAPPDAAKQTIAWKLSANPGALLADKTPLVLGTLASITFVPPPSSDPNAPPPQYDLSPAAAAPGQPFSLVGARLLGGDPTNQLYLLHADGTEEDKTSWIVAPRAIGTQPARSTDSRLWLTIPTSGAPDPGVYQLRVGHGSPASAPGAVRSSATPFSVAPWVSPLGGPTVTWPSVAGPSVTVTGSGFLAVAGATEVLLEVVALRAALDPTGAWVDPQPGEFRVVDASTITLVAPAGLATGQYLIRVRVHGVEAAPAKWLVVT